MPLSIGMTVQNTSGTVLDVNIGTGEYIMHVTATWAVGGAAHISALVNAQADVVAGRLRRQHNGVVETECDALVAWTMSGRCIRLETHHLHDYPHAYRLEAWLGAAGSEDFARLIVEALHDDGCVDMWVTGADGQSLALSPCAFLTGGLLGAQSAASKQTLRKESK